MTITPILTITANQLISHAIGDYLIQSDWMANNKTKSVFPALTHALSYAIPFGCLTTPSLEALSVIIVTHFAIDHWRLARFVCFGKNFFSPRSDWPTWNDCSITGYPSDRPAWLAVWLLIIADNILHVLINGIALQYIR